MKLNATLKACAGSVCVRTSSSWVSNALRRTAVLCDAGLCIFMCYSFLYAELRLRSLQPAPTQCAMLTFSRLQAAEALRWSYCNDFETPKPKVFN